MQGFVSDDFYRILSQISDQNYHFEHIIEVFRREIPPIAARNGIVLIKARVVEPVRRSNQMNSTEIGIFEDTEGKEYVTQIQEFPIGNRGYVEVITGIDHDVEWTEALKRDVYVAARMIYLLVGRAKTMAALSDMMFVDQLTGIPNEVKLTQFMGMTMEQGRFTDYCSNFLNIKNMKLLNNRFSDRLGDEILQSYAKIISEFATNRGNGIAARLGGDNFLVFLEASKEEEFLEYMRNLRVTHTGNDGVKSEFKIDSRIGYHFIQAGEDVSDAMRNADVASKTARNTSLPDYVQFEESMKTQILRRSQLEQSIPDAIKQREFVVFYQPKAHIANAEQYTTCGAEALVRWSKDGELISPGEFVPILEKSGLITQIDFYVFERVCEDINDWIARGIEPVKVSSNFSRRHLQDVDFADKVEKIIKKHHVDTKYIEIEITESYDDEDMQALSNFEKRMHELGVSLSVDDFGSGFSSIKMIKNIVADTIKLDKSIIDGIGEGGPDDIIVSHIIMMINKLGKNVIAEGVETEVQAKFLRENGCDYIQGFLYGRPCPKDAFETYIQ